MDGATYVVLLMTLIVVEFPLFIGEVICVGQMKEHVKPYDLLHGREVLHHERLVC